MSDDGRLAKCAIIERCVARARSEFADDAAQLRENLTKQDSIILNLQRSCEAAIDLAMRLVASDQLGVPQTSREARTIFSFLRSMC